MKSTASRLSALITTCSLAACSTVSVTTDYDHATSFAKYKTYALEPAGHGEKLSPVSEAAFTSALHSSLAARGITQAAASKATLAVAPHFFLQNKVSVQQFTDWGYGYHGAWPYGYGYYGMWAGAPRTYVDVTQYAEGTMVLDFVDTHTKKLVFRGTGQAVVGGAESNAGKIREAVEKIVASLPIPAR